LQYELNLTILKGSTLKRIEFIGNKKVILLKIKIKRKKNKNEITK